MLRLSLSLLVARLSCGCALHYYDASTGTEHLWGLGHMKMSVVASGEKKTTQAVLVGVQTAGLRLDLAPNTRGFSLGYDDTRTATVLDASAPLKIQTISGEPFTLQLGTPPPWAVASH